MTCYLTCYFCQKPTVTCNSSATKCSQHLYTIFHINNPFKNYIGFESNQSSYKSVFTFYVYPTENMLNIGYQPLNSNRKYIYFGPIPKNFTPENAVDFAQRILNMKAFL